MSFEFPILIEVKEVSGHSKNQAPPVVSILVLTFNQASFIQQCIESLLNQKTDFNFEIVIGEDDSTDGTREICKKLLSQYPEKIKLLLHWEINKIKNSLGNPTGKFNLMYSIQQCSGKYIAFCEGDDYWTDKFKLQKQVDFLETNAEYVAVFTDFDKSYEQTGKMINDFNSNSRKIIKTCDISMNHLFSRDIKYLRTLTSIFRASVLKEFKFYFLHAAGDSQWIFHALQSGKIKYFNYSTGVYRVLSESASHSKSFTKKQLFLENYVSFLHVVNSRYALHRREIRHINKMTMMAKLRQEAHVKKLLSVCLISIQLILHFHFSRNVLRNIKYAFRKH